MRKKHSISTDSLLNEELADQVGNLRGGMMAQALKIKCSDQFTFENDKDRPSVTITNTLNGKKYSVGLCSYRDVREALNELI